MRSTTANSTATFTESRAGLLLRNAAIVLGATLLIAVCAHVSVPLPWTPVPLTMQTFAVLLIGLSLRPSASFAVMALYLIEGALGLPVFQPFALGGVSQLFGPTGGYLFSYPLAAACAGVLYYLLHRTIKSQFVSATIAATAGSVLILAMGAAWLSYFLPGHAFVAGIAPFLLGDAIKICAAAGIVSAWGRTRKDYKNYKGLIQI